MTRVMLVTFLMIDVEYWRQNEYLTFLLPTSIHPSILTYILKRKKDLYLQNSAICGLFMTTLEKILFFVS